MNIPYFWSLKRLCPLCLPVDSAIGRHFASSSSISGDPGTPDPHGGEANNCVLQIQKAAEDNEITVQSFMVTE